MDTGYYPHDGCAVDQMALGAEPNISDISYLQHYGEVHGAIYPELTFMPHSLDPMTEDSPEQQETVVSISTVFYPGAHTLESDTCLSSSDRVLFYVHSQIIRAACEEAFSSFLCYSPSADAHARHAGIIDIPDEAKVLNIILHTLYATSCAQHSPSIETLTTAVGRMPFYNIDPKTFIQPGLPLYTILLSYAPLYPILIYSLAAHFDLEQLAINSSSHLLSYQLSSITDGLAQRMGPIYLKRLMCLHHERNAALRDILLVPPHPHPETKDCSFANQKALTRAWALVSAYLAWEARSDLSTSHLQRALDPLTEQLTCKECHQTLQKRIRDSVVQWASMKRTI